MHENYLFTSESITEGHLDKVCDQISDANLDAFLELYTGTRFIRQIVTISGVIFEIKEITSSAELNIENIVKKTLKDIGYIRAKYGTDSKSRTLHTYSYSQPLYIISSIDKSLKNELGICSDKFDTDAWDHVIFKYVCNETEGGMLLAIFLVYILLKRTEGKKTGVLPYLCSDGKSQATVKYLNDKPAQIDIAIISVLYKPNFLQDENTGNIYKRFILSYIPATSQEQLAYAASIAQPISINIDNLKTGKVSESAMCYPEKEMAKAHPKTIIKKYNLEKFICKKTAAYRHCESTHFPRKKQIFYFFK